MFETSCGLFFREESRRSGHDGSPLELSIQRTGRTNWGGVEAKLYHSLIPPPFIRPGSSNISAPKLPCRTVFFCIQCVFCAPQGCACPCFLCKAGGEMTSMDFFSKAGVEFILKALFVRCVTGFEIQQMFRCFSLNFVWSWYQYMHTFFSNLIPENIKSLLSCRRLLWRQTYSIFQDAHITWT